VCGGAHGFGTAQQAGILREQFLMLLEFFINLIILAAPWPWGRLNLEQK
jgi:hypothetical protein